MHFWANSQSRKFDWLLFPTLLKWRMCSIQKRSCLFYQEEESCAIRSCKKALHFHSLLIVQCLICRKVTFRTFISLMFLKTNVNRAMLWLISKQKNILSLSLRKKSWKMQGWNHPCLSLVSNRFRKWLTQKLRNSKKMEKSSSISEQRHVTSWKCRNSKANAVKL